MRQWLRLVGRASPGARVVERDGVTAAVIPVAAERAVLNSVVYEYPAGLAAAYDEVAAAYAEIGAAWTVWVPSRDEGARAALHRAGHALDAAPAVMAADLSGGVERPPAGALEGWTADGDVREVGPLNDRSYTFGTDSFSRAYADLPADELTTYVARLGGRAAGCLMVIDHEGNADVEMVAVVPEARGQGIAGKLLAHALADAVERGLETSTLVATRLGRPVYERLGYREFGTLQMWERRSPT
ncbi:MAG TPA: GNAT family N-acetyltransferase [Thermoleophilaceae bacterium]|nr:GNAT family N-acetyltransferase [Thermoleophilaceae bacterium]